MPDVGAEAPVFSGTDIISNGSFDSEENREDIILLSFFEYEDDPSIIVIECLKELWNIYEGHNVQIVVVYPDDEPDSQSEATIKSWLVNQLGVTFPAIYAGDIWNDYMAGIDVRDIPHTFIIDKYSNGFRTIKGRYFGGPDSEFCEDLKCSLLDVKIERDPIDLEMVMDVSNSMNYGSPSDPQGDTKFTMMKQAINIIGDYLKVNSLCNDKMGLIWFTDDVSEYD